MWTVIVLCFSALALVCGQNLNQNIPSESAFDLDDNLPKNLHNGLTERIGNFSIELLYHTAKVQPLGQNLILSPITAWTILAVIAEGASADTALQINNALRVSTKHRNATRHGFNMIYEWLQVNTSTVELQKINAGFVDQRRLLLADYQALAEDVYKTKIVPLDFQDSTRTANTINEAISRVTRGRITKLVDGGDLSHTPMILTSGLYFRGQWSVPFNASQTTRMPFFNSLNQKIGEVNMMYSHANYPFASIPELQAKVIEMRYGIENRLSMLIMLPNPNVSLENMFLNFGKVPLDTLFKELRIAKEEYGEDEVDCFIPRFKIESNLDLTQVLRYNLGISDLFDERLARLPYIARTPMYVSKVIHKAEIEVTEQGTVASAVSAAEFSNRMGTIQFVANKPFCYLIVEKVTNSIVFGGLYQQPSLF